LYRENNADATSTKHSIPFKPSHNRILKTSAPYQYISDPGKAKGPPNKLKNFVNNPPKRGYGNTTYGHLFSVPKYVEDPFDRP